MKRVTKITWRIKTGSQWWSGTDTEVDMEIYRDSTLLQRLRLEPGNTSRLNRLEDALYYWVFQAPPSTVGVSYSGFTPPYYVEFPADIAGHLRVRFIARGDDAWEKVAIYSSVVSGEIRSVPGTIDSLYWDEHWDDFAFTRDIVLSTDSSEGYTALTLNY